MRHRFFHSAYFFAIMAVLLWSTVSTAFKLTLRHLTPLGLLFFSSLFAAVFLGVYSLKSTQGSGHKYFRRNLIASWKAGTLNPFIYYLMLFNAYDRLPAQQAQVLNYTWAIVLPLMTLAVMKEKLRLLDIAALALSFAGVIVISTQGRLQELRFEDPLGVGIAISTSLVWAAYWILSLKDPRPAATKLLYNFTFGTILILIWSAIAIFWDGSAWFVDGASPLRGIAGALYIGLFEMGVTFLLWYYALRKASSTASVSNLIFVTPFLSLGLIALVLKESIYPATIAGLVIIIISNLIQKAGHKQRSAPTGPQ